MADKLTIQDIARLAGVSKATVSRVLNHKPDVDPATRERVLRIVEEENFVPSLTAAWLAGGRPRMIGVVDARDRVTMRVDESVSARSPGMVGRGAG